MARSPRSGGGPQSSGTELPKGLSQPAIRALVAAGYCRLAQLDGASEARLASLHGMGPKGIRTIKAELASHRGRLAP
jgi:hypothetical protein